MASQAIPPHPFTPPTLRLPLERVLLSGRQPQRIPVTTAITVAPVTHWQIAVSVKR
jgi:hypothetical protein